MALSQTPQKQFVKGMAIDPNKSIRLTHVFIRNVNSETGRFTNFRGEFALHALPGDTLIANLPGYRPDTLLVRVGQLSHIFYLQADARPLPEVTVKDSRQASQKWLDQQNKDNQSTYRRNSTDNLLNVNKGGAGVSIDAIYNLFSREAKDVKKMQAYIAAEYKERVIDQRFTAELVQKITNLKGDILPDFMQQYRPTYSFVVLANDYDFIRAIRQNFQQYRLNNASLRLPKLRSN